MMQRKESITKCQLQQYLFNVIRAISRLFLKTLFPIRVSGIFLVPMANFIEGSGQSQVLPINPGSRTSPGPRFDFFKIKFITFCHIVTITVTSEDVC